MTERRQLGLAAAIAAVTGEAIALGIFLTPVRYLETTVCLQRQRKSSSDDGFSPTTTLRHPGKMLRRPGRQTTVSRRRSVSSGDGNPPATTVRRPGKMFRHPGRQTGFSGRRFASSDGGDPLRTPALLQG
jgi:hypothetical protein